MKKATSTKYTFGRDENEPEIDEEALKNAKSELEAQTIVDTAKKKRRKKKEEKEYLDLPNEFEDLKVDTKVNQKEADAREKGGPDFESDSDLRASFRIS